MQHGAVKTEALLDEDPSSPPRHNKATVRFLDDAAAANGQRSHSPAQEESEWYHQERQQQSHEPEGGPSVSQAQPLAKRSKVKFAADDSEPHQTAAGTEASAGTAYDSSRLQQLQTGTDGSGSYSSRQQIGGEAAPAGPQNSGLLGQFKKSFAESRNFPAPAGSASVRLLHASSLKKQAAAAAAAAAQVGDQEAPAGPARTPSIFSASIKGLFGGASSKLLGSLINRGSMKPKTEPDAEEQKEELWFTTLDDFKPICHMLHKGRYMSAYFACANKTGQHFLLKKYDKHKMLPAEERGVRRSIALAELLQHQNLVKCMGQWEAEDIIYVVEEYAGKGDIFNDAISHPEKYTERYVAVTLVKPLLQVLAYLHANNIIHRSVLPENLYMAIDDVLKLGHLTLAVDQLSDRPKSRTTLLDYMAPEMLSVKPHNEHELAHVLDDSSEDEQDADQQQDSAAGSPVQQPGLGSEQQQQQGVGHRQQQQKQHHEPPDPQQHSPRQQQQQSPAGLDVLGRPVSAATLQQTSPKQQGLASEESEALTVTSRHSSRSRPRSRNSVTDAGGQAEWEHLDYYDEKVDIWQVGCLVHELLCGSMPFEVESKIDSAGLALWADIEQPPGSLPPDCVNFLQQALTKDPKQRPAAEQLLDHPWLARCESGEPWRDALELEAARKAAELATISGWLAHHGRAVAAGLSSSINFLLHGSRVQPMVDTQQHGVEFLPYSAPVSPDRARPSKNPSFMDTATDHAAAAAAEVVLKVQLPPAKFQQQHSQQQQLQDSGSLQHQQQWQQHADPNGVSNHDVVRDSSSPVPLKLTAELVSQLNTGWEAEQRTNRNKAPGSSKSDSSSMQQQSGGQSVCDLDDNVQAACVISLPDKGTAAAANRGDSKGVSFAVDGQKAATAGIGSLKQQQQQQHPQAAVDVV